MGRGKKISLIKDREKMSDPRAEFLLKFAYMTDEQFEAWSKLETSAEARAFMSALPMPPMRSNTVSITLERGNG